MLPPSSPNWLIKSRHRCELVKAEGMLTLQDLRWQQT